jgi:myo-inositol-1(or 4)-monophosphatase
MTRYGGDCYQYGLLAHGFIDLIVEATLKPFDIHALIPIIEGAGGVVTNWEGEAANEGGRVVAAGDSRAHAAALDQLQKTLA